MICKKNRPKPKLGTAGRLLSTLYELRVTNYELKAPLKLVPMVSVGTDVWMLDVFISTYLTQSVRVAFPRRSVGTSSKCTLQTANF